MVEAETSFACVDPNLSFQENRWIRVENPEQRNLPGEDDQVSSRGINRMNIELPLLGDCSDLLSDQRVGVSTGAVVCQDVLGDSLD